MSKQVLDRNQMEHLCELGIDTTQATMCWIKQHDDDGTSKDILCMHDEFCYEFSSLDPEPAFTLQDIIHKLPKQINGAELVINFCSDYVSYDKVSNRVKVEVYKCIMGKTCTIDAAYEMLCWCIENEYVRTESN